MSRWSDGHISNLIKIVAELNCLSVLDGKRTRNAEVYDKVAEKLNELCSTTYSMDQVRAKFKKLKLRYKEERAAANKSGIFQSITSNTNAVLYMSLLYYSGVHL